MQRPLLAFAALATGLAITAAALVFRVNSTERSSSGSPEQARARESHDAPGLTPSPRAVSEGAPTDVGVADNLLLTESERETFDVGRRTFRVVGLDPLDPRRIRNVVFSPDPIHFSFRVEEVVARTDTLEPLPEYQVTIEPGLTSDPVDWIRLAAQSSTTSTVDTWEKRGRVGIRRATIDLSVSFGTEPEEDETLFLVVTSDRIEVYRERWSVVPRVSPLAHITHAADADGQVRPVPRGITRVEATLRAFPIRLLECRLWAVDGVSLAVHEVHAAVGDMRLEAPLPETPPLTGELSVKIQHHPDEGVGRVQLVLEDAGGRRVVRECVP